MRFGSNLSFAIRKHTLKCRQKNFLSQRKKSIVFEFTDKWKNLLDRIHPRMAFIQHYLNNQGFLRPDRWTLVSGFNGLITKLADLNTDITKDDMCLLENIGTQDEKRQIIDAIG